MIWMLSKKQLAIILSQLKTNPHPKPDLEQYEIPGELAAEIINYACLSDDVEGKIILDLGCGSGRLAIGCSLMGAKKVVGVDVDEKVLKIFQENVKKAGELVGKNISNIKWKNADIEDFRKRVDTVIQNPPFGIQKEHADRIFIKKALECGNKVYSLHRSYHKSREFISKYVENFGGKVENIIQYKFRLPHTFKFHEKPAVNFDVDLFVIRRSKNI